jgi:ribosome-binding protein aMBF1 (putative translation factor)
VGTGQPLVLQVPVYGKTFLSDGWPADRAAFGEAIRRARTERNWSMATLAHRANVTEPTIRNLERGRTTAEPKTRESLIAALGQPAPTSQQASEES